VKNNTLYKGIFYTCLASLFWGLPQPLFFNEIKFVSALEVASHRGIWSFIFLSLIIICSGKIKFFFNLFKSYKKILVLSLTAILISINWAGFIFAISINRLQDASMGYYITPMISIGLGFLFLKESISPLKFISILMMFSSLIFLFISLKTVPFIAILIAITWGVYGLLRKQINVSSEIGLLYESGFITLIAAPYLIYLNYQGTGYFLNSTSMTSVFLILTGIVTIFPLFFFNLGVKIIPLGFAGVIFFLAPTCHFLASIFILKENLNTSKLISFIIIWIAIIVFIIDIFKEEKKIIENNTQLLS
jgi:chloramphenicol-sensitive protein RarD|tara:strand:+ start:59 stop:973 length:915 start_codon:yes stop_codon:yes gene_type:complete